MSKNPLLILLAGILLMAALPGCDYFIIGESSVKPVPSPTQTIDEIIADIEPDQVDLNRATATNNPPTDSEKADLAYAREEAKLARDLYQKFNEKWNLPVFAALAKTEQGYMDRVKALLDGLKLPDPALSAAGEFTQPAIKQTYASLLNKGMASPADALAAGAYLEEQLVKDLGGRVESVFRLDIIRGLGAFYSGARTNLRTLVTELKNRGVTYTPQLLGADEFDRIINPKLK